MSERSEAQPVEEELSLEDFYRYLSEWEGYYPNGIPTEVIEEASSRGDHSQPRTSVEILFGGGSAKAAFIGSLREVGAEEKALFRAAIEKGLQWNLEDVVLIVLPDKAGELENELKASLSREIPVLLLGDSVLGCEDASSGKTVEQMLEENGLSASSTESLRAVLKEKAAKKRFWEDLKSL